MWTGTSSCEEGSCVEKIMIMFPKQQTTFEKLLLVVLIFYEEYFADSTMSGFDFLLLRCLTISQNSWYRLNDVNMEPSHEQFHKVLTSEDALALIVLLDFFTNEGVGHLLSFEMATIQTFLNRLCHFHDSEGNVSDN